MALANTFVLPHFPPLVNNVLVCVKFIPTGSARLQLAG